jgi:hypothetical protein
LGSIASHNWFFISDLASILRGLTGDVSYVTVVAIAFVPLAYFILWRTAFGLRLRSAGEAPVAAESLGVNVYAMKYAGVLISGGFAGLGGGFLAIVAASNYQENQVAGRGYIGLAALLFGNYRPGGLTALLDGIGKSIEAIRRKYDQEIREDLASVVIVILTDGGENASKFYTRNLIAETIKELDATGKWTFSFLGADLDAVSASDNLNIRKENIISFSKGNYDKVMHQMSSSIRNYENMKSAGNMKSNLFDDIDEKDQRNFTK